MAEGNTERLIPIALNGNGYTTVQDFTSVHFIRPDQLKDAINVNMFAGIGKIQSREGYSPKGGAAGNAILGMYTHFTRDGVATPIRVAGTKIQYWNGSAWADSNITTLTAGKIPSFTTFINRTIMVNGAEKYSTADGITWDTTLVSGMSISTPIYVDHFATRLIYADKTTVYYSSLPQGTSPSFTLNYNVKFSITPETDDGDFITGVKRLGFKELIFKNYSIHKLTINGDFAPTLFPISEEIGCPNIESVVSYQGYCYFFGVTRDGERGFYRTSGGAPELISRGVTSWTNQITESLFAGIRARLHKGVISWFVGDIDIANCEIEYSPRDDGWQRSSLRSDVTAGAAMQFGAEKWTYFGAADGYVYKDKSGEKFVLGSGDQYEIQFDFTTHKIFIDSIEFKRFMRKFAASGQNLALINVAIRTDDSEEYRPVKNTTLRTDVFVGNFSDYYSRVQFNVTSTKYGAVVEKLQCSAKEKDRTDV